MNRSQRRTKMNKLIFASLLSVGAILAAQTPAAAPAPAATSKTATSKVKTVKKHHSKKTTAVSNSVKPAAK
jgi:hypothetical protein